MSKFRQAVERALAKYYVPYNTTFGVPPDPDWDRIYDFYEARYLNPDSPERDNEETINPGCLAATRAGDHTPNDGDA